MKVKSLSSLTEAAGAEGAVKTAIKYQIGNSTDLVPHHAAKSTIVRGAPTNVVSTLDSIERALIRHGVIPFSIPKPGVRLL
jgi:hypothetical protein